MYRVIYKYTEYYNYITPYSSKDYFWVAEKKAWFLWFRVWDVNACYTKEAALDELRLHLVNLAEIHTKQKDVTYVGS